MARLREGMIVRTSYGTGPYVVTNITHGCTCPSFLDSLDMSNPPASAPHLHITCRRVGEKRSDYFLNGYDEDTLMSVWSDDYLIIEETEMLLTIICIL